VTSGAQEVGINVTAGAGEYWRRIKMIGRWIDMAGRTGVMIVESNDLAAVHRFIGQWNPYMDIDLTPVVDDEESAVISRQIIADNNART
jgi:hypothetical protein